MSSPHLTDAELAAALDPSNGGGPGAAARAHAAECLPCAVLLREARRADQEVAETLRALDHPVPPVDMAQIVARATATDHVRPSGVGGAVPRVPTGRRVGAHPGSVHRRVRWGLGMTALGLAAAAATALAPQSPLRQLFARVFASPGSGHTARPAPSSTVAPQPPPAVPLEAPSVPRGVAVVPTRPIVVQFRLGQRAGVIRILPGRGGRVAVRASGDGPTYDVGRDTVAIDNRGVDTVNYDVELPADARAPTVRVRVGERTVYLREGDRTRAVVPADQAGRYTIPLVPVPHEERRGAPDVRQR